MKQLLNSLPAWIKVFFGYESLLKLVYNPKTKNSNQASIDLLESIAEFVQSEQASSAGTTDGLEPELSYLKGLSLYLDMLRAVDPGFAHEFDQEYQVQARLNTTYETIRNDFVEPNSLFTLDHFMQLLSQHKESECSQEKENLLHHHDNP